MADLTSEAMKKYGIKLTEVGSSWCILLVALMILIVSCTVKETNKKILILGNSITQHGPLPSEGWFGNWGMAASAMEKDYVHVLIDTLKKHSPGMRLDFKAINIAYWERNFDFDFSTEELTKDLGSYKPDILIIRLGENLPEEYARSHDYESALAKLIARFKAEDSHVLITGNFWPASYNDSIQSKVASEYGYEYVELYDLASDGNNKALKQFQGGVGNHPSDTGMRKIAVRIFERINKKNWFEEGWF